MIRFIKNENNIIKTEIKAIIPTIIRISYIKNILTFISYLNYKCKDLFILKKCVGKIYFSSISLNFSSEIIVIPSD